VGILNPLLGVDGQRFLDRKAFTNTENVIAGKKRPSEASYSGAKRVLSLVIGVFSASPLWPSKTGNEWHSEAKNQLLKRLAVMSDTQASWLWTKRYYVLFGVYLLGTGAAFIRVSRQPYTRSMKLEQYETIFKSTTLGTTLVGIGLSLRKRP